MKQKRILSRIRTEVTTVLLPLLAIAAYVLGWPSDVSDGLMLLYFATLYGTWKDWGRFRTRWAARLALGRKRRARRLSA